MARRQEAKDEIDYVRELLRGVLWHIAYHEHAMPKAQAQLEYAKALLQRANIDPKGERAKNDKDGDPIIRNVAQFALNHYDDTESGLKYHEDGLDKAYRELALVKLLLRRGDYTEIKIEEEQKNVDEEQREREAEG
jgi:hypothetical protein